MKKYNKPNLEVIKIAPEANIANAGLESWVLGNEITSTTNLSTYEYQSE